MSSSQHSYGPTCRLSQPSTTSLDRNSAADDAPPPLRGQFFYSYGQAIDDPLSPLPSISSLASSSVPRHPSRPFSGFDNAALEEAWQGLQQQKPMGGDTRQEVAGSGERLANGPANRFEGLGIAEPTSSLESSKLPGSDDLEDFSLDGASSDASKVHGVKTPPADSISDARTELLKDKGKYSPYGASPGKDTTGTPFARAPSRSHVGQVPEQELDNAGGTGGTGGEDQGSTADRSPSSSHYEGAEIPSPRVEETEKVSVPVGISQLHQVELPELQMKPIYWSVSRAQDVSKVIRGTWFYRESMLPVEADVANQLELGYSELRPWSETWRDELNSAVAVGAEGEEKIAHGLWPKPARRAGTGSRPVTATEGTSSPAGIGSRSPPTHLDGPGTLRARDGKSNEAAAAAAAAPAASAGAESARLYPKCSVIYANGREAFILWPGQLPSAYYNRRPLAKIRKGTAVGIPVLRGFDWRAWEKLHPSWRTRVVAETERAASASQSGVASMDTGRHCVACLGRETRPRVTDLILVVHGIGQKYSERDESFNFTHSINTFRRQIHVQLGTDAVKSRLRRDFGGLMVLPVNWRSTVSFEDDMRPQKGPQDNDFSLTDITPSTIPTVRNLISDVMLDIPYYLSDHRPKMIQAVIREANRIYRLWCKNNPGFHETGHCHLLAHSLGSAMALDILSSQPTKLPAEVDPTAQKLNEEYLNFDTKSLFFCGSPAGFFLLLKRSSLLPRKGREKPEAEGEDLGNGIAGEAGTYGCLAVDNLYNVVNYTDPVGYLLNAALDTNYAASLKPASVPSTSTSLLSTLTTNPFRTAPPPSSQRPSLNRTLPSTIELATHDFSAEEIAEKKFLLLNDNGQLDWFLSSAQGPLDGLPYLNMLGAHSSYWLSRDFVHFLVVEIGRPRGRSSTLEGVRARKKGGLGSAA
ncbi:MAG: hypothetical protein M1832_003614 [Thelocarpon impressellum]|nr:MAG: hypothetical protein M1832_003614 [Thelocarpon impressellum]